MTTLLLLLVAADGAQWLDSQPLRFENSGRAAYVARGRGFAMSLNAASHELVLPGQRILTRLTGSNSAAAMSGEGEFPALTHYFQGSSHLAARNFARVRSRGVYPGIDLVFHGRAGQLEYDFVVAPGARPESIAFAVEGATPRVNEEGELELTEGVRWKRPEVYQETGSARRSVESRYVVDGQRVRFALGPYDRTRELVIDPVLAFSSLAGRAANDGLRGIGVDAAGNVYVAGTALSPDLPRTVGPAFAGRQGTSLFPVGDAFVAKFNPAGGLVYLTYLGGDAEDCAMALAVDRAGNA